MIKKEIRSKQMENCLIQEQMMKDFFYDQKTIEKSNIYSINGINHIEKSIELAENNSSSIKNSLKDFKLKCKHLSLHSEESNDNILKDLNSEEKIKKNNIYGVYSNKNEYYYKNKIEKRIKFIEKTYSACILEKLDNFNKETFKINKNQKNFLKKTNTKHKNHKSDISNIGKINYLDETSRLLRNLKLMKKDNIDSLLLSNSVIQEPEKTEENSRIYPKNRSKTYINILNPILLPEIVHK